MEWLKEIRLSRNMKQEDVSSAAGIERAYYSMIECGKRTPSVTVAKAITAALGIDWQRFFE